MEPKTKVGLAFQGGVIPAGSFEAGVVKALVDYGAFERYEFCAFSGTSAGAVVASTCWGHAMEGTIKDLPDAVRQQWMDMALGIVPNAKVAEAMLLAEHLARLNPVYDYLAQKVRVPFVRDFMKDWVTKYMDFEKWLSLKEAKPKGEVPGLLLGSSDVLEGEIKVFTEDDFCLNTVLASGSLDETNGMTVIKTGSNEGIYLDGAWGINPPISGLIDYGVDEVWLVQIFPKARETIPSSPAERKDRKDELWQNSLVEHERDKIEFVNKWRKALNAGIAEIEPDRKEFKLISVRTIAMERDLPAGAAFVNSKSFVEEMMDYGYHQAHRFLHELEDADAKKAA